MRKIDKYHNVGTVPESNRKIVKRSKIDTSHIPSLGSGTIKMVEVKPGLWVLISQAVYAKNSISFSYLLVAVVVA